MKGREIVNSAPRPREMSVQLSSMLAGDHEWTNISEIVRSSLKVLNEIVIEQAERIEQLENALAICARRSETESRMERAESRIDQKISEMVSTTERNFQTRIAEMEGTLRAELSRDLSAIGRQVASKAERAVVETQIGAIRSVQEATSAEVASELSDVRHELNRKAGVSDMERMREEMVSKGTLASELSRLELRLNTDLRARIAEAHAPLEESVRAAERDLKRVARRVQKDGAATADALRGVGDAIDAFQEEIGAVKKEVARERGEVEGVAERLKDLESGTHALREALQGKASERDVSEGLASVREEVGRVRDVAVSSKARPQTGVAALHERQKDSEGALADLTRAVGRVAEETRERLRVVGDVAERAASTAEGLEREAARKEQVERVASDVQDLKEALNERPRVKDVTALLNTKADVEEVNALASEMARELHSKATREALERSLRDQAVVNALVAGDLQSARWLWKSGGVLKGGVVPWDVEAFNGDPEALGWEPGRGYVVAMLPGLYEVSFGFFSSKRPTVQLLVNGAPVLAAVNSSSYVLHHSSGRVAAVGSHPDGNIAGSTMVDFLSLPPRARVAISFKGNAASGEGFLALRKL